jgi:hypothetical protein
MSMMAQYPGGHACPGSGPLPLFRTEADERIASLETDALRYRWLRDQDWDTAKMCVVIEPKKNVKLGSDCPSRERLDDAIDKAMGGER